jgi:transposase, IS30 family
MRKYHHLGYQERIAIRVLGKAKLRQREIASLLGFDKGTISREISRNYSGAGYRFKFAHKLALSRQRYRRRPRKLTDEIKTRINKLLRKKWSPQQISFRLKHEGNASVSHETIYKYAYENRKKGGFLYKNLRYSHRKRKRRFPSEKRQGCLKNTLSIERRSKLIDKRARLGDWERDTMFGTSRKLSVLVCVDRKSRFMKIAKLKGKIGRHVTATTLDLLKNLPCRSITNDRGFEFSDHRRLSNKIGVQVYFCHPYSSHERGSNENKIGLLRQYFPKGINLGQVRKKRLKKVEIEMNNRPLKCLDWRTPYEVLLRKKVALTT